MKSLIIAALLLAAPALFADDQAYVPKLATYKVPFPEDRPDLEKFSQFDVHITSPYHGPSTQTISYTFPEILTGNPPLSVTLNRVPGSASSWTSPMINAECTDVAAVFSCTMNFADSVDRTQVVDILATANFMVTNKGVPFTELGPRLEVIQNFLSGEPIGVLTYAY